MSTNRDKSQKNKTVITSYSIHYTKLYEEGVRARDPRAYTQADFFIIAEVIRSEAVLLASMRVCWFKWLYLSVTFGDAWPSIV